MRIIIIGSGLAGQVVLRELRQKGFDGDVEMYTQHGGEFYSKPSLSNVFTQKKEPKDLIQMTKEQVEENLSCKIINEQVVSIDRNQRKIQTESGNRSYDRLVLATGSVPVEQSWLPTSKSICRVNYLEDYQLFHQQLNNEARVAIIGGGLIGVEFSHDIVDHCAQLTLIESMPSLMYGALPNEIGQEIETHLDKRGVDVYTNQHITEITEDGPVTLNLGSRTIEADVVLAAIGLRPEVNLAKSSGLEVDRGIRVNQLGQTSDPNIYAIGDCAEVCGILRYYVSSIRQCASAIAMNLMNQETMIHYEPMLVNLKTPSYPVCFCYKDRPSEWQVKRHDYGTEAYSYQDGQLVAFALSGECVKQRMALKDAMENWL